MINLRNSINLDDKLTNAICSQVVQLMELGEAMWVRKEEVKAGVVIV